MIIFNNITDLYKYIKRYTFNIKMDMIYLFVVIWDILGYSKSLKDIFFKVVFIIVLIVKFG